MVKILQNEHFAALDGKKEIYGVIFKEKRETFFAETKEGTNKNVGDDLDLTNKKQLGLSDALTAPGDDDVG